MEEYNAKRSRVAISLGVICWVLGLGSVLSFNLLADVHVAGSMTFFDFVDYVSQNLMLPLGGLAIALFAGFVLPKANVRAQLGLNGGLPELLWNVLVRAVSPLAVLAIFGYTIYQNIG